MIELINKQVKDIGLTGIRKFAYKVSEYKNVVDLTIGQPDFLTPEHIKAAGNSAINENYTSYSHSAGFLDLREAASQFFYKKYKLSYDPLDEIIVTNGASEGIDIAFRTILSEGSEVILPAPVYPGYEPLIKLCGAVPVYVDTSSNNFKINAGMIRSKMTEQTRCIVLSYPSNPMGTILNQEELVEIANLLRDKQIFILSDEIYSELNYNHDHVSIASLPGMKEKTIIINGLAKSHSMTGWRIGFALTPSYLFNEMLKVHAYNSVCASSVSQKAAIAALTAGINDPLAMKEEYRKRRDYAFNRLVSMGLDVIKPEGAFYLFPSIKKTGMKSYEFAIELLETQGVAVVPGDSFSIFGEGHIRISYAYSMDILEKGLNRLEEFVKCRTPACM